MRPLAHLTVILTVLTACASQPAPYPAMRQTREQEVPGTFGFRLRPPGDAEVEVSPERAVGIAMRGGEAPGKALVSLATVDGAFVARADRPAGDVTAWVVAIRNLCFASQKGDLVSSSRRDPEDVERCGDANLWITVVDPSTGETLSAVSGYDAGLTWEPATG